MGWFEIVLWGIIVLLLGVGQYVLAKEVELLRKRLYVLEGEKKSLDNVWEALRITAKDLKEIRGLLGDTGKSMGVIWARVNEQGDKIEALDKEIEDLLAK